MSCYYRPLIWLVGCSALSAYAHEGGHGPTLHGKGPHGGRLSAVISASEATQGRQAKIRGVAEWLHQGNHLTIYLHDEKGRSPVSIPSASTVKWIVMGSQITKPEVFRSLTEGTRSKLDYVFPADLFGRAESVEVILPTRDDLSDKRVFLVKLQ